MIEEKMVYAGLDDVTEPRKGLTVWGVKVRDAWHGEATGNFLWAFSEKGARQKATKHMMGDRYVTVEPMPNHLIARIPEAADAVLRFRALEGSEQNGWAVFTRGPTGDVESVRLLDMAGRER